MQQRMIIFLHRSEPLLASWIVLDEAGRIIQSVSESSLTAGIKDAETIVIVPTLDVLITQASLPKMNRQRLLQALPFALEEQLLDDVENLHFAIGEYQADQPLPVAVVSKQKIEAWLAAFKALDISPVAFIPSIFVLPTEFSNTHDGIVDVRTGKFSGFACDENNFDTFLSIKKAEQKEEVVLQSEKLSPLQLIERQAATFFEELPLNLLQNAYRSKRKTTHTKRIWMLAGYLFLAWIGVLFFSNVVSFFILHHQVSSLDQEIYQIYKRNFPQATSLVAPRERMQDKMKSVFSEANKNNFLALLGLIGKGLSETKGVRFQNLDFREKQVTLDIIATNFDILDAFTSHMTQENLTVKRQNAAIQGTEVKASLIISAGES